MYLNYWSRLNVQEIFSCSSLSASVVGLNLLSPFLSPSALSRGLRVEERPIQKEYLSRHHWKWEVPHLCHAHITALLHCRLQEGFLLASAHSGHITLIAELSFKVSKEGSQMGAFIPCRKHEHLRNCMPHRHSDNCFLTLSLNLFTLTSTAPIGTIFQGRHV